MPACVFSQSCILDSFHHNNHHYINSKLLLMVVSMYQVQVDTSNIDWGFLKPFGGWAARFPTTNQSYFTAQYEEGSFLLQLLRIGQLKGPFKSRPQIRAFCTSNHISVVFSMHQRMTLESICNP